MERWKAGARHRVRWIAGGVLVVAAVFLMFSQAAPTAEAAGPTSLTVTPWQVYVNNNTYSNPYTADALHGYPTEFSNAPAIPAVNSASWADCGPGGPTRSSPNQSGLVYMCPKANTIGMNAPTGSILTSCWTQLNFTYFQSLVSIPDAHHAQLVHGQHERS